MGHYESRTVIDEAAVASCNMKCEANINRIEEKIQALELDSTNIISVVRGFGYIEECIRRINDHGVQKHVLNLALSKFDHQWYHDNEVDSVKWRLESMRDHIKSYSAPKVPPYHDKNIPNQKKKAHTNVNNHAIVLAESRNIINFAPNFNIKHSLFRLYPCQIKPQEQRCQM